ncbi:ferrochelatase-like [Panicum virgatum]|uniref:ferrochelatase-like n=1 Tax=Panicum virgatum TaxID=38727 RepID=UPI0019D526C0|nr:ferrochelatase-like [Panicum virgatum]
MSMVVDRSFMEGSFTVKQLEILSKIRTKSLSPESGYQLPKNESRVGPVEWLKPYTDEIIILLSLGRKGSRAFWLFPLGKS